MELISTALALANYAPKIIRWITGSDKAEEAASAVVQIAKEVTGKSEPDEALAAMKADPALAIQFRTRMTEVSAEMDKAYLADTQDARKRDSLFITMGKANWRANLMFVMAVAITVMLTVLVWKSPELNEYTKGIVTLVLGRFLGYLDQIYQFEFGSTRTSKSKDETINKLVR